MTALTAAYRWLTRHTTGRLDAWVRRNVIDDETTWIVEQPLTRIHDDGLDLFLWQRECAELEPLADALMSRATRIHQQREPGGES